MNKNMSHSFCSVVTYKMFVFEIQCKELKRCICCKYLCVVRNFCPKKFKRTYQEGF